MLPRACAAVGLCPRRPVPTPSSRKLLRPSSLRHRPSHAASSPSLDLRTCRWCGGWDNAYDHYSYWRILDQFPAETRAMVVLPRDSVFKVPPFALAQLGPCTSSGRAWRLWAARHSQGEASPLGAQPPPRLLERAASKVAIFHCDLTVQAPPTKLNAEAAARFVKHALAPSMLAAPVPS